MIQIGPSAREEIIGIVEKTDTATHAITAGQYVVWKGVGCVAASDISVGSTLSSSNLTAVSNGVANDIKNKIPSVSDSLSDTSTTNALSAAKGKALNDSISTLNTQITPHAYTAYTIDTTKMTVGNANLTKCIIAGGICCLQVYSATFTSVGSNQTGFITGLPKAKCQMGAVCAGANVDNTAAINAAGTTFWIGDGGTALNGHIGGGDNTRGHWITLTYPIDA